MYIASRPSKPNTMAKSQTATVGARTTGETELNIKSQAMCFVSNCRHVCRYNYEYRGPMWKGWAEWVTVGRIWGRVLSQTSVWQRAHCRAACLTSSEEYYYFICSAIGDKSLQCRLKSTLNINSCPSNRYQVHICMWKRCSRHGRYRNGRDLRLYWIWSGFSIDRTYSK